MIVAFDRLATNVTTARTTHTMHHVASLGLVKSLLALIADADHRLGHSILDPGSHIHLLLLLDLVAAQWQVIRLLAFSESCKS